MINTFQKDFDVHRLGFFSLSTGEFYPCHDVIIEGKNQIKKES